MDFGGDIAEFSDKEQSALHAALAKRLGLSLKDLSVTRHAADQSGLNYGALGHGKIFHPTKVQLNFRFVGTHAIEHGYKLEKEVASGTFSLSGTLDRFPLLRLEMEEIYCTKAPTAEPTDAPTNAPSFAPTVSPTQKPSASPTEPPSHIPSATPTEVPTTLPPTTDDPSFSPTQTPTEVPTAVPTVAPTEEPSVEPTEVPTAEPTLTPTALPTEAPTAAPSFLPTEEPTKAPTGCFVTGAKMHIQFKNDKPVSRKLLMAITTESFKTHTGELLRAVAKELKLAESQLSSNSYHKSGIWYSEIMFKGSEAIRLGYKLEQNVLANKFNPLPGYPIHRLYMEEIFDCGEHAVGATHKFDGSNGEPVKFTLPESGWKR
jgi:hypothetical protein